MIVRTLKPRLRRRVVTIFVVAVLVPCVFLGYVGLNSIKQEKQWQQQLVLENLRRSLSLAVDRIESGLDNRVRSAFGQLLPSQQLTAGYITSLRSFSSESPLVHGVFLLDGAGHAVFPRPFRDAEGTDDERTPRLPDDDHLRAGDLLESQGRYDEAIAEYRLGSTSRPSRPLRVALLSRIARCQSRQGDFENARLTYQKVIAEDRNQFYAEEMPYVLVAHLQLLEIAESAGSAEAIGNELRAFYSALVDHYDKCQRGQHLFFLNQVKSRWAKHARSLSRSQQAALDSIARVEQTVEEEQRFREAIQETIVPKFRQDVEPGKRGNPISGNLGGKDDIRYTSATIDSVVWLVALRKSDDQRSVGKYVGFTIRHNALREAAQAEVGQAKPGEDVRLALIDALNAIVSPSELATASVVLTQPFGRFEPIASGVRLSFVTTGEDPLEAISSQSLLIYYILFGFVIVLIALGIVFILRDISRQEEISAMKSEFIANVSHEIKTPIATIRTLAENLNEGWVTGRTQQREYFHLIEREAGRLTHLVENILDFSRIDRARRSYRMELAPIGDVTRKAIARFRSLVDGLGAEVREDIEANLPACPLDVEAYEQALLNLLDNAVKYSQDEKVVEVSASRENNSIVVRVTDHGIGIQSKDRQRIFEKFYRTPTNDGRKIPGSGIGLTLVKETVEAHAGSITVESEVGKGSEFVLTFPLPVGNSQGLAPMAKTNQPQRY